MDEEIFGENPLDETVGPDLVLDDCVRQGIKLKRMYFAERLA